VIFDPGAILRAGKAVSGLAGGSGPWALIQRGPTPAWVLVPTPEDAARWVRALRFHQRQLSARERLLVLPYPADDTQAFDGRSPDPILPMQRLIARHSRRALVVAPAAALTLKVPSLQRLVLSVGDMISPETVIRWLVGFGYLRSHEPDGPATLSARGGLVDIWPVGAEAPVRIEWFEDEIELLKSYDPENPSKNRRLEQLTLIPAREAPLTAESAERAAAFLHQRAAGREQGPDRRRLLEEIRAGHWAAGLEGYLPALTGLEPLCLKGPVFLIEPSVLKLELEKACEHIHRRYDQLEPAERPYLEVEDRYDLSATLPSHSQVLPLSSLPIPDTAQLGARSTVYLKVGGGDPAPVASLLLERAEASYCVVVVAESQSRAERARQVFSNHGLEFDSGIPAPGKIVLEVGDLPEGFETPGLLMVTVAELFGNRLTGDPEPASRRIRRATSSFANLKKGDPVVHEQHGIGLYQRLVHRSIDEVEGDFLEIEYLGGDRLLLPIHRIGLLSVWRAPGEDKSPPVLDRLGGVSWSLRRAKVRDTLLALAHQLISSEARRKIFKIKPLPALSTLYRQFEAAFPYEETPDQSTAIMEVLEDLQKESPMDRLLIGDVGFGKTEVAMRAAFCIVEAGFQVAVLCPTTVLAWQHLHTFKDRFKEFPFIIEGLSRFSSAKESSTVVEKLKAGSVDILIGTHRLLSRDIRFKNLGMVILDEEHRFGVRQKQALKEATLGVRVLAMSATPIPRTLQLALGGLRSLSILATPPSTRKPVKTEILPYNEQRILDDLRFELARGGQSFFLHNRVESLPGVAEWLKKHLPLARVDIAHGQMQDDALEKAMIRLVERQTDILVCTTIIENGLHIPTVNTLIINNAEDFGLAQAYQLRGRVGRGDVQARCTLLVGSNETGNRAVLERLSALAEASELGSGLRLATRDMELRGSGDLLGEKQHGTMAAIGLDAYIELLGEVVAEAKGQSHAGHWEPDLKLEIPAFLPESWCADLGERLDAYGRLASILNEAELQSTINRLERRYGESPPEAQGLYWLSKVRMQARSLGISSIENRVTSIFIGLRPDSPLPVERLLGLCRDEPGRFRLTKDGRIGVAIPPATGAEARVELRQSLERVLDRFFGLLEKKSLFSH
jgi:transcription-repair coupling factor (superfamily II helicase)